MNQHWAETLFVEHGETYKSILEGLLPKAKEEATWVARMLADHDVKPGSSVLDLACGIGRHSVELARLGYRVTGVDLSPTHIERANKLAKDEQVLDHTEFMVGDMRHVGRLLQGRQFHAIINLFTSFGYYDEQTDVDILKQCQALSHEQGFFLMETISRDRLARIFQPNGFEQIEDLLILQERTLNVEASRMDNHWTILKKIDDDHFKKVATIDLDHQLYNLHELIKLFEQAGWTYQEAYGGLDGSDFETFSSRMAVLFSRK